MYTTCQRLDISEVVLWWSKQAEFSSNYLALLLHFLLRSSTKLIFFETIVWWQLSRSCFIIMDWICVLLNKHNQQMTSIFTISKRRKGCQRVYMCNSCRMSLCIALPLDISEKVLWCAKQAADIWYTLKHYKINKIKRL